MHLSTTPVARQGQSGTHRKHSCRWEIHTEQWAKIIGEEGLQRLQNISLFAGLSLLYMKVSYKSKDLSKLQSLAKSLT